MPLPYVQTDHRLYEDSLLGNWTDRPTVHPYNSICAHRSVMYQLSATTEGNIPLRKTKNNNTLTLKTTTTNDTFQRNSSLARVFLGYFNTHQCNHKVHREESRSQEARSRIVNLVVHILGFFAIRTDDFYTHSPRLAFTGCLPRVVGFTYSFLPCINGTTT